MSEINVNPRELSMQDMEIDLSMINSELSPETTLESEVLLQS